MTNVFDKSVARPPSASELSDLCRSLSKERIGSYKRAAGGDIAKAVELHMWNTRVSGSFYGPLQFVELALRNAVHDRMSATYGPSWLRPSRSPNSKILNEKEARRVSEARAQLRQRKKKPTAGRVVAELNFGFWVALFANRYDNLWHSKLAHMFSSRPRRREVHEALTHLRDLRNRIAHHEPIHQLPLDERYYEIQWLAKMLAPDAASWVLNYSQVPQLLAERRTW